MVASEECPMFQLLVNRIDKRSVLMPVEICGCHTSALQLKPIISARVKNLLVSIQAYQILAMAMRHVTK